MKNYFIANGTVLNTDMSIEEIEERVQKDLDQDTAGLVNFEIQMMNEREVRMIYYRDCLTHDPNLPVIYDFDMNLICGLGIMAFQRMEVGGYPLIFPLDFDGKNFYTSVTSFIRFYKTLLFVGANYQQIEHIGIRCYSDKILMQIIF